MKKICCILLVALSCSVSFSQSCTGLDSLRQFYMDKQIYDTAMYYAEKTRQCVIEKLGENHPDYAVSLNNIASIYYFTGKYKDAEPLYKEVMRVQKETLGEKHPEYALAINNMASFYYTTGNFIESESLFKETIKIRKEILGEKHPDYAISLGNLATLYISMGNYTLAETFLKETIKIKKEVLGEGHPEYAQSINNLAYVYKTMGNYTEAERLYIESMKIRKEALGEKHSDYAQSINNLAVLYTVIGNYSASEPLYMESMKIYKEVIGEKHPDYSMSLNNLAVLYKNMGNYTAAEPLYLESLKIQKESKGENHPDYAVSLNNMALLYKEIGKYKEAETMYLESIKIRKEVLGEKHRDYASSLSDLALLYKATGNYTEAERLYIESLKIRKETLGEKHPEYAISLNNLSALYYSMGNYEAAEPLINEAVKIRKQIFGEKHPDYVNSLINLSQLYRNNGNEILAEPLFLNVIETINSNINQNFSFLSEAEKEKYFKTQEYVFAGFYSYAYDRKNDNADITKQVFNNVLINKGLLLKSSAAMRSKIINSNDTALISQYKKWVELKKNISTIYSTAISKRKKNPEELEQQANILEKELVKRSQVFSDFKNMQQLNWESVKNNLKPGEAAVEFIRFRNNAINKKSKDEADTIVYCALIVKPASTQPDMIMLFEETELENIIDNYSQNNLSSVNNIYGTNKNQNEQLYNIIWQPLEKYLSEVKTIYYSPDGILHKVSFAAIGKGENMYLCDNYNLQQVSSTGKVAMPESTLWDENLTAGLFGGIEYSTDTTAVQVWNYLPGTKTETDKIVGVLKKKKIETIYFSGTVATEDTIKAIASNCNILHVSTHGFFYPDPEQVIQKEKEVEKVDSGLVAFRGGSTGFGLWQFVKNKNPLMRSGIVMAGANNVWNQRFVGEGEDGVLTAQEVSQLDLSKTKLVVLSACETGLGDIKGSEGVYGLQRAFKMAGVKYIIMSLWQVPDKETVEFMEMFYKKLLKIKDVRTAFTETQKEMRQKYDPYYWGAFVLIE